MNEIFDAGVLEDGVCGGGLDLGTYITWASIPLYNGLPDPVRYHMLTAHEDGHWARWLGTTIGMTLTSMRYAGQRLIRDSLSSLPRPDREALFGRRRSGTPIFSLAGPPLVEEIHLEWQMWADLQVAYSGIYDSERLKSQRRDVGAAVSSALTDALYWELPLHGRERGDFHVNLNPGDVKFLRYGGKGLTSKALFEAIGLADELMAWGVPGEDSPMHSELEARYRAMLETSYGSPHNVFVALTGADSSWPTQAAVTVAVLADFALNPPLPPWVDSTAGREFRWQDIYPPTRFVRACDAMRESELLSADPSDDEIRDYICEISDSSGMMNPLSYSSRNMNLEDQALMRQFDFESPEIGSSDHDRVKGDYIALLDWAARRLWKLRSSEPGLLLLHGQGALRKERLNKAALLLSEEGAGWYTAPFQKLPDGRVGFRDEISSEVVGQFMTSLAFYSAMHQLACKTGPFTPEEFPNIPSLQDRWQEIKEAVNSIMQYQVW